MAPRAGQCLHGIRVAAGERGAQVADHPARSFRQGQLDRLVEIWPNSAEQARNLKDGNLADQLVCDLKGPTSGAAAR
jgi:hypothetical protein